jgi:hypothetical protein
MMSGVGSFWFCVEALLSRIFDWHVARSECEDGPECEDGLSYKEMFNVLSNLPNIKGVEFKGFTAVDMEVATSLLSHDKVTQVRLYLKSLAVQALASRGPRLLR